jgi:zinc transporter ZupT
MKKWLAIVLLVVLGYVGLVISFKILSFLMSSFVEGMEYNTYGTLGYIVGFLLAGYFVYLGIKKLVPIIKRHK